jgi:O-antigen/teichoic acid export membrane protein
MHCCDASERHDRLQTTLPHAPSFGARVLQTGGTNMLLALLGLITGSLAARLLGPAGRGELAAIQMWPLLLAAVASLGLPQALTYFAARSAEAAGRCFGSAVLLALLSSLPFALLGYVALPHVLSAQSPDVVAASRWYLLLLPVQAAVSMPLHLLRGRSDFTVWNLLRLVPGLGWLGVLVTGWLLGRSAPRFFAFSYLSVLATLVLLTFSVARARVSGSFRPKPQEWRPLLAYGLPTVLTHVPQLLNLRLDQVLMAALLPAQTLGFYVVAVTWSSAVGHLPNALATVLLPRTASQADAARRRAVFAQGGRLAVLSALSVACMVGLVTPWALPLLFGEKFLASVPAALVLVGAAAIAAVNSVLEEGLRGLGHPGTAFMAELTGLAVTIGALALLLPPFGIMGAAMASVAGYGTVGVLLVAFSLRLTGVSPSALLCPNTADLQRILQRLQWYPASAVADSSNVPSRST